jgi:hypothetical protein
MVMRRLAAFCLFVSIGCAQAVAAAPTGAPDPTRIAAAEKLLDKMHFDQLTDRTVEAMIADAQKAFPAQLEARMGQALPAVLKDKLFAVIAASLRRGMTLNRANMRRGTVMIYASRFTAPELAHMIELQNDPVMVKMQAELPQIMAESAALGSAAMQSEMPRMAKDIEQIVKDYFAANGDKPAT